MLIRGEWTLEDLIALPRNLARTSKKIKNINMISLIICIVIVFFFIQPSINLFLIVYKSIIILIFANLATYFQELIVIWKFKKSDYENSLKSFEIRLNEEGIHIQRKDGVFQLSWTEIQRVTYDNNHYFLYRDNQSAIIIPRREVSPGVDFLSFLLTYIPQKRLDKKSATRSNRKIMIIGLSIALIVLLILGYYFFKNDNNTVVAVQKVEALFVTDEIVEEGSSKIKDSTNQQQIDEALEAIYNIDVSGEKHGEDYVIVMGLEVSVLIAQKQLNVRVSTSKLSQTNAQEERNSIESIEGFEALEDDVVYKDNAIKNKTLLEEFIIDVGNRAENQIRVVKYEWEQGALLYDLKSVYDKEAGVGWVEVRPDLSYYTPETIEIFNSYPQQCSDIVKDEINGFYNFHECHSHWEYSLFPIVDDAAGVDVE